MHWMPGVRTPIRRFFVFPVSFSPRRKEAPEGAAYIRTKLFVLFGTSWWIFFPVDCPIWLRRCRAMLSAGVNKRCSVN
jgi:hypothetical protein